MKILLVDDNRTTHFVLSALLNKHGHDVISAFDGVSAIQMFECVHPDIILMDVVMPRMNGLEAATEIKKRCSYNFVPIIFISADGSPEAITECIERGGDDYIVKPFDNAVLVAKVLSMARIREQHENLITHRVNLDNELEIANHVFETILDQGRLNLPYLNYKSRPVSRFCSDLLLCKHAPAGGINFLLADFGGFGLPAAMSSIPVLDIFYSMTLKGFSIGDIVVELNKKLLSIFSDKMYCSAVLGAINPEKSSLTIWNGGMPDLVITTPKGKIFSKISLGHQSLGIVGGDSFDSTVDIVSVDEHSRIYIMSDGLIAGLSSPQEPSGLKQFEKIVTSNNSDMIAHVFDLLDRISCDSDQVDDITLAEFLVHAIDTNPVSDSKVVNVAKQPSLWSVGLSFDAITLRDLNVVPIILNLIMDVQAPEGHRERLFTIISELFNNALEHGILGLDSKMKLNPEGFVKYYEERASRLGVLTDANVKIDVNHSPSDDGGKLEISILDTGPGFDYKSLQLNIGSNSTFSGRGIALINNLCSRLDYSDKGNKVTVVYEW